eukprot:7614156-Pyramimonas_sp.AAC.1
MIQEGRIEEAMEAAEEAAPGVLSQPGVEFQLSCQQAVETLRHRQERGTEAETAGCDANRPLSTATAALTHPLLRRRVRFRWRSAA